MANTGLINAHQAAAYANPQAGQSGTASVVLGNDNTTVTIYNTHDSDPTIHLQNSVVASRPAAASNIGPWMTNDATTSGTSVRMFISDGASWFELSRLNKNVGIGAQGGYPSSLQIVAAAGDLTGSVTNYGINLDVTGGTAATTSVLGLNIQIASQAAAYTLGTATAIFVPAIVKGTSSVIVTAVGLQIASVTVGTTNYAIFTGLGKAHFGDVFNVVGAATFGATVQHATTISVGNATPAASGAGVTFPAAASGSADANTLDDYEEGTFTAAVAIGGSSTGITYSAQAGTYTKIGRSVSITIDVALTSKGTNTGAVTITGLPFTASGFVNCAVGFYANFTTMGMPVALGNLGTVLTMRFAGVSGAIGALDTNLTNTSQYIVSANYNTAS